MSRLALGLDVGGLQRWAAVALLLATVVLELADLAREWPRMRPPVEPETCLSLCAWSGTGVAAWSYEGCTCDTDTNDEPEEPTP